MQLQGEGGLFLILGKITDPRKARGIRHEVQSILAIAICATLTGMCSFVAIGEWAKELSQEMLKKLGVVNLI